MQKRGFLWLAGATLLLVVAAIVVAVRSGGEAGPPKGVDARALPQLAGKLGELAWIRLTHGNTKTDFAEIGGTWTVTEKGNYPAAVAKVRQMLLALADLTLAEPKTERPDLFARLGLDDPKNGHATLVALQNHAGATVAELIVGRHRIDRFGGGEDGVYVRRPDENRTWLARGALDLSAEPVDWLDRHVLSIPERRVASVALTDETGATLSLHRAGDTDPFTVDGMPNGAKLKPPPVVAEPAGALQDLELIDVKPAAELAIPDQSIARAVYTTFDGLELTLRLVRRDNADWVAVSAAGHGAAAAEAKAIDDRLGRWGYAIPETQANLMRRKMADMVEPPKGS